MILVFGVALTWRILQIAGDGTDDQLDVRNHFSTKTIARNEIDAVRTGTPPNLPVGGLCVFATTADEVVTLDATACPSSSAPDSGSKAPSPPCAPGKMATIRPRRPSTEASPEEVVLGRYRRVVATIQILDLLEDAYETIQRRSRA